MSGSPQTAAISSSWLHQIHVDGCLHLAGCVWGAYLDDPPAARLKLRYLG